MWTFSLQQQQQQLDCVCGDGTPLKRSIHHRCSLVHRNLDAASAWSYPVPQTDIAYIYLNIVLHAYLSMLEWVRLKEKTKTIFTITHDDVHFIIDHQYVLENILE